MALAIVHFLVGAALLVLLATPTVLRYRLSPWIPLWLVAAGGLWGMFPDIHHIAPVYQAELQIFHGSRWANLFAFHYTLDRLAILQQYNASIFMALLLFLAAVGVFTLVAVAQTRISIAETTVSHLMALMTIATLALLTIVTIGGLL